MAEQSSHDVVNQTRSGGELSPSDVPASTPDNFTAGGDAEGVGKNTINQPQQQMNSRPQEDKPSAPGTKTDSIPDEKSTIKPRTVSFPDYR